jgi:hypothetical protein
MRRGEMADPLPRGDASQAEGRGRNQSRNPKAHCGRNQALHRPGGLKTPEAQKAFADDVLKIGQEHYGFTPQDLAQKMDHRDLLVLKDAIAYRKLQADKPKALEKVKDVPPVTVQAPGRRVSAPERAAQAVSDKLAAARRSGGLSMADALSLINDIS